MPERIVSSAATRKFLLRKPDNLRLFSPPRGSSGAHPKLLAAQSGPFDCNSLAVAPLEGTSYNTGYFSLDDHIVTIRKPGVYLIAASVFFATYDPAVTPPSDASPSSWGHIQQAGATFGTERGAAFSYVPVVVGTPNYAGGYESVPTQDLIRFTNIFTTFRNDMDFVLTASATFSHPQDHPVVARADVRSLKIVPLEVYE